MAFIDYSMKQLAAKVVYYGPGMSGKTTNLQWVFEHTSADSRGEMLTLEDSNGNTVGYDVLPVYVGSIAGFNTQIQLYTVPGSALFPSGRKMLLQGVDGVVFVADSQQPMLEANIASLRELTENLDDRVWFPCWTFLPSSGRHGCGNVTDGEEDPWQNS